MNLQEVGQRIEGEFKGVRIPLDIRDIGQIFGDPAGINIFSIFRARFKDFGSIWLYQERVLSIRA